MKSYNFETSMGTVTVSIDGEYSNGCKDISVWVQYDGEEKGEKDFYAEKYFEDTDNADDVFEWLQAQDVKFLNASAAWFAWNYVQSVMIDHDATEADLLEELRGKSQSDLERFCARNDLELV